MKAEVRYYSQTGNTKKLADAIGAAINADVATVDKPLTEKVDFLFLGSAVYAAGIDKSVKDFIVANRENIGCIVNFSTAALLPSTYNQVKKLADANNIKMCDDNFACRGAFALLHKGRPNADDCKAAADFAKALLEKNGQN